MNEDRIVVEWAKNSLGGIEDLGFSKIWTEIDLEGRVIREIGFNQAGFAIHFASALTRSNFLFDRQKIVLPQSVDNLDDGHHIAVVDFDNLWRLHDRR